MLPALLGTILVSMSSVSAPAEPTTTSRLDVLDSTDAAPAPVLRVRLDEDEPITLPIELPRSGAESESASADGRLRGARELQDGSFVVRWDLAFDPDPRDHATIEGTVTMVNRTDVPVSFDAVLSMPLSPLIDGPTRLGGRAEVALENDGDGGRLDVPAGDALVRVLFDGVEVHRLHRGPFAMGGPSTGVTSADAQFGAPIPGKEAGPVTDTLGCRMKAAVTSGDQVTLTIRLELAGDAENFIRRRSTAPVRIEAPRERRVITIGGKRPAVRGRSGKPGGAGTITIAPTAR